MEKILIADSAAVFAGALESALQGRFQIKRCADGETALTLLQSFRPDILIINLMLPYLDGLCVLQKTPFQPQIILVTTNYLSSYMERAVTELGVDYTMIMPSVESLRLRLEDLLRSRDKARPPQDMEKAAAHHLHQLGVPTHLDGYRQLCVALPLFAKQPQQLLTKELYPAVAAYFDSRDSRAVEHSIRKAIRAAWLHRDNAVWRRYFPPEPGGRIRYPSNKVFLCTLAQILNGE